MVAQLIQKQCIREMSVTERGFFLGYFWSPIPVPRRLAEPIPVSTAGETVDRSTSQTVPPSRPISKSREVRAGTHAGDRVSRRKVRFATRTSVPHGGTPSHSDATSS